METEKKRLNSKILVKAIIAFAVFAAIVAVIVLFAVPFITDRYYSASISFSYPDGSKTDSRAKIGSVIELPPAKEFENRTFIGWYDENGNPVFDSEITVCENVSYKAKYIVSLNTVKHVAYIFADENGFLFPEKPMTRGDAALMFSALLCEPVKPTDFYIDIDKDSPYYNAASELKTLKIDNSVRFHPEDELTREELICYIAAFYPPTLNTYEFADISAYDECYGAFCLAADMGWIKSGKTVKSGRSEIITREDTVLLMNTVLNRKPENAATRKQVGGLLDCVPGSDMYWQLAEAAVSHQFELTDKGEKWTSSTPLKKRPEGIVFIGNQLYYIDKNGCLYRNCIKDGFEFDSSGKFTTGREELDKLIKEVYDNVLTDDMDMEARLHALFDYMVDSFTYIRRNPKDFRDISWQLDEAYSMLSTGCGNCYSYASTFCELARGIGYDAVIYSGYIGMNMAPHSWCEIEIDGENYIFDTEIEMAYKYNRGIRLDMYMLSYKDARKWVYIR